MVWQGFDWNNEPSLIEMRIEATGIPVFVTQAGQSAKLLGFGDERHMRYVSVNDNWYEYSGKDTDFVYYFGNDGDGDTIRVDPALKLPRLVEFGKSYSSTSTLVFNGNQFGQASMAVKAIERTSLTVPAGTFNDVVSVEETFTGPDGSSTRIIYLARGLGIIKRVNISPADLEASRELLSYAGMLWRDATPGPGGWLSLPWFGWFMDAGSDWIYHAEHGWLYARGTTTSDPWLYDVALGCWWWTSDAYYPFLYKTGANAGWYWYQRGGAPGARWFYRLGDGKWVQEGDINAVPPSVFALIPAGNFEMGDAMGDFYYDELPVHTVYLSAFYMQTTEVTKAQWDDVAGWASSHGYEITPSDGAGQGPNYPVHAWWYECVMYANAKSEREGLTPVYTVGSSVMRGGGSTPDINYSANGYRLPTEAEWEKAARGGLSGKRFPWGDMISHSQANYFSTTYYSYDVSPTRGLHPTYDDGLGISTGTSPVGSFAPNGYGLYDMAGNLWEYCADWYSSDYYATSPGSNPTGPPTDYRVSTRVLRGGSWMDEAWSCRVSCRRKPGGSTLNGFRLARNSGG